MSNYYSGTLISTQGMCISCIMCMYITLSAVYLCDNTGLVSLILSGWELHASYITVLCVQAITILCLLPSQGYIPHSNFYIICVKEELMNLQFCMEISFPPGGILHRNIISSLSLSLLMSSINMCAFVQSFVHMYVYMIGPQLVWIIKVPLGVC